MQSGGRAITNTHRWHVLCTGMVLNYAGVSVLTPAEMSSSARQVLRFIDLGGHEKYLKTALYGMTCMVSPAQLSVMLLFAVHCRLIRA